MGAGGSQGRHAVAFWHSLRHKPRQNYPCAHENIWFASLCAMTVTCPQLWNEEKREIMVSRLVEQHRGFTPLPPLAALHAWRASLCLFPLLFGIIFYMKSHPFSTTLLYVRSSIVPPTGCGHTVPQRVFIVHSIAPVCATVQWHNKHLNMNEGNYLLLFLNKLKNTILGKVC